MANIFDTVASHKILTEQARKAAESVDQISSAMNRARNATVAFGARGDITMENFGRIASAATKKVLVWQIAILAVYGVMRKITETIQVWRELEVTLARIGITTGAVSDELYQYFRRVADVAIEFGVPIEQTLIGMDLALRATAKFTDTTERAAVATQLLRDASVLANITGMQYSQSIDILVGSLRQSAMEMNEGIKLLDKWVAVSKNAAVSVADLSQGFAIMADAARAAGLTVDQVNGLIAALSEAVTLGPVEIGNAIRALMSTLYNPGSISLLQKYGVAVRDAGGEVRSFWDVMTQLSAMRVAGVLDDAVWLEIAKAAGAGQRRYAQFMALLNNFTTAMRVSQISSRAQGEALDANARIVNTLTNSFDKFTAAQRKFLFAIGDQVGVINDLNKALLGLTGMFNALSNASPGVYALARAVFYLVGALAALKVASLAAGWMGLGPRMGAGIGGLAGISRFQIAGTAAAATAAQAGIVGAGAVAPGMAARAGLLGVSGLIPGLSTRLAQRWGLAGGIGWRGGAWRTPGGQFAPVPTVGGQAIRPATWGGVGRWATRGMGGGMAAVGGLGLGAAAYGLTGEPITAAATGIAAGIGGILGGPVGMMAGAAIGGVIAQTVVDAFVAEGDRIRDMWGDIAKVFGFEAADAIKRDIEIVTPDELEKAKRLAKEAAPKLPEAMFAEAQPMWKRLFTGGVGFGGPVSPVTPVGFAPFGRTGEEEWKEGYGAINELNQALVDGVITIEEYRKAKQKDYIAWDQLSDRAKAYMQATRLAAQGNEVWRDSADDMLVKIKEQIAITEELSKIANKYSTDQERIKNLIKEVGAAVEGLTLKQYEEVEWAKLLSKQARMSAEDFDREQGAVVGLSYGFAAHVVAIQRIREEYGSLADGIEALPIEKYMEIQKWNPGLATDITQTTQTLISLKNTMDAFYTDTAKRIAEAFDEITTVTSENLTDVAKILEDRIPQATGEQRRELEEWYNQLVKIIEGEEEYVNLLKMTQAYLARGAGYQYRGQIRIVGAEDLERYREEMGRLPQFRELAQNLGEWGTTVLTLVDPLTQQILTLDDNTLALQFLQRAVSENTDAQNQRLEAEYNLPGWYERPNRYWALRTLGPQAGGFGPMQEGLWSNWLEFVRNRSMQGGGTVRETGPYFLHKKEVVSSGDTLTSTNVILGNSYRVLLISQQYLSSINLGVLGLRQEMQQLRQLMAEQIQAGDAGTTQFSRITKANYIGVSSLGVRRK